MVIKVAIRDAEGMPSGRGVRLKPATGEGIMETPLRSVVKAITWRACGLITTSTVVWVLTQRVDLAASVGLADTAVKLLAYYGHERLWLRIRFGRLPPPDYEV